MGQSSLELVKHSLLHDVLVAAFLIHQHVQRLFDGEAAGLLARRKVSESCQMLADDGLRRNEQKRMLHEPVLVFASLQVGKLEGVGSQIEQLGGAQANQRLHPDFEPVRQLLHEYDLVLVVAQSGEIAIIGPVEELATLVRAGAGQQVTLVVTIGCTLKVLSPAL
jgi:hypothetical protein